jgi:nucleoside-diphosphate-sugar epimerase
MRILVTGCAGFIGSHLCERLVALGHEVIGIDALTDYYALDVKRSNLSRLHEDSRFVFHNLDLAVDDLSSLLEGVDVVYHEAGQPGVRASWGNYFETYTRNNVLATQRLLEAVKHLPLQKFVYASSSSIYGDAESFPTAESTIPAPVSPYGVTKLAAEHLVYTYWRNYGLPTMSLRYFTVYGPRQRPDMAFHRFISRALKGETIRVYGDGEQTRSFTYVGDVVAANIAAATSSAAGVAVNIGGGAQASVNETLRLIEELIERPLSVRYEDTQRGDVRHTAAETRLARQALCFSARVGIEEGLTAEVEWLVSQGQVAPSRASFDRALRRA